MIVLRLNPPSVPADSKTLAIPPGAGKGFIHYLALASGIQLLVMDFTLDRPIRVEYVPPFKSTGIGFYLSGSSQVHSAKVTPQTLIKQGQTVLNYFPDLPGLSETIAPQQVTRLGIMMNEDLLERFSPPPVDGHPLSQNHEGALQGHHIGQITPPMQSVIHQILTCPLTGTCRQVFLEAKALELTAYQLDQYISPSASRQQHNIKPGDLERVSQAADLLSQNPDSAPDLEELARSAGMCRSKFHISFRAAYGITPFEYLRRYRLNTARAYLDQGRMNVTEAAYAVGYSSPSYFTKAFKKQFGYLPGKRP